MPSEPDPSRPPLPLRLSFRGAPVSGVSPVYVSAPTTPEAAPASLPLLSNITMSPAPSPALSTGSPNLRSRSTSPTRSPSPPASSSNLQRIHELTRPRPEPDNSLTQRAVDMASLAADKSVVWGAYARETGAEIGRRFDAWKRSRDPVAPLPTSNPNLHLPTGSGPPAIFAIPLAMVPSVNTEYGPLPQFIHHAIAYLDDRGVSELGLYRVSGRQTTIQNLRRALDAGQSVDFYAIDESPHVVAALLKVFLRELPEPIIPVDLREQLAVTLSRICPTANPKPKPNIPLTGPNRPAGVEELIAAASAVAPSIPTPSPMDTAEQERRIDEVIPYIRAILACLPPHATALLAALSNHLGIVADHEPENRMSIANLGVIFCPTLGIGSILFRILIRRTPDLFPVTSPPEISRPRPSPGPEVDVRVGAGLGGQINYTISPSLSRSTTPDAPEVTPSISHVASTPHSPPLPSNPTTSLSRSKTDAAAYRRREESATTLASALDSLIPPEGPAGGSIGRASSADVAEIERMKDMGLVGMNHADSAGGESFGVLNLSPRLNSRPRGQPVSKRTAALVAQFESPSP